MQARLDQVLALIEARLAQSDHLAGGEFTAADIMSVFSLSTMRLFHPIDLAPYPNVLAYLQRVGGRPAYQRAMAKGDPDLTPNSDLKPSKSKRVLAPRSLGAPGVPQCVSESRGGSGRSPGGKGAIPF